MFDYKAGDGGQGQRQAPTSESTSVCGIDLPTFYFFLAFCLHIIFFFNVFVSIIHTILINMETTIICVDSLSLYYIIIHIEYYQATNLLFIPHSQK